MVNYNYLSQIFNRDQQSEPMKKNVSGQNRHILSPAYASIRKGKFITHIDVYFSVLVGLESV
jgi:hypothetical protein